MQTDSSRRVTSGGRVPVTVKTARLAHCHLGIAASRSPQWMREPYAPLPQRRKGIGGLGDTIPILLHTIQQRSTFSTFCW